MLIPKNIKDVYLEYCKFLERNLKKENSKNIKNQFQTTILRYFVSGLKESPVFNSQKMNQAEINTAFEILENLPIKQLNQAQEILQIGFTRLNASVHTQNTYQTRLNKFLDWCQEQYWWQQIDFQAHNPRSKYAPRFKIGHGKRNRKKRTSRDVFHVKYQLQASEINPKLAQELKEFESFLTDPYCRSRLTAPVSASTAQIYLKHTKLMLGWHYHQQGIELEKLSLQLLIPLVKETDLVGLNQIQIKQLWFDHKQIFKTWLNQYFVFLEKELKALSPNTKNFKLNTLSAVGKFLYRSEIEITDDYQKIPILKTINHYSRINQQNIKKRRKQERDSDWFKLNWPDVEKNKTALTTVRENVLEPLRLKCRAIYDNWHLRDPSAIAKSQQIYFAWSLLADIPPRRQEEYCSLKVALSCPLKPPEKIPPDGMIHPLVSPSLRSQLADGTLGDNYLYKTYYYQDKFYSEGLWILDIHQYKTKKSYGPQKIVIYNSQFPDGTCLYDYIERHLYGWWQLNNGFELPSQLAWQSYLQGQSGKWLTLGRTNLVGEVANQKTPTGDWFSGYVFVKGLSQDPHDENSFGALIANAAHQCIGKNITPHRMRHIWATWAFQVGLSDQQKESLAYAMGHDLKTLEQFYEQCSPDEKRRPIEDVISVLYFEQLILDNKEQKEVYCSQIYKQIEQLPRFEQDLLLKQIKESLKAKDSNPSTNQTPIPDNFWAVYQLYLEQVKQEQSEPTASYTIKETQSAVFQCFLLGYCYPNSVSLMNPTALNQSISYLKTIKLDQIVNYRQIMLKGFAKRHLSQKTRSVYELRLERLFNWMQQQSWWEGPRLNPDYHDNLCCPVAPCAKPFSGTKAKVTMSQGKKIPYRLKEQEINPNLKSQLQQFEQFLIEPYHSLRLTKEVKLVTKQRYFKELYLMLGWFVRYRQIPLNELKLELLIPQILTCDLVNLTEIEQKKRWQEQKQYVQTWLCEHFTFLDEEIKSSSVRNKKGRLDALSALARFLYATEVEDVSDYDQIPIFKVINQYHCQLSQQKNLPHSSLDFQKKWPDVIEGETALTAIRKTVVEPLRLATRPKDHRGKFRRPTEIALSHQRYLIWSLLADIPPRRISEYISLKISLTCPVERPQGVNSNELIHPLPPDFIRGNDNYLYKTKDYQGHTEVWILSIRDYKTVDQYGPQSIVIPNRLFEDGRTFYEHLEHYLYGWWLPGGRKNQTFYDWYDLNLLGKRGKWVTQGRNQFCPHDACYLPSDHDPQLWSWGYLFLQPYQGISYNSHNLTQSNQNKFSSFVSHTAFILSGKATNPHLMRHIWATWAFQVGLTRQEQESLAYAMGHRWSTLKKMYEKCSPHEKRKPIEDVISVLFFRETTNQSLVLGYKGVKLLEQIKLLTPSERHQLLKHFEVLIDKN